MAREKGSHRHGIDLPHVGRSIEPSRLQRALTAGVGNGVRGFPYGHCRAWDRLCGMAQLTDLPPDRLLERAQQLRELGEVWRYLMWELADALEALAQEKQQNRECGPG